MSERKPIIVYNNFGLPHNYNVSYEKNPVDSRKRKSESEESTMSSEIIFFTNLQKHELLANGLSQNQGKNHVPVAYIEVKRFGYTFLLTELNPQNSDLAFGLCDYGTDIKFSTFSLENLKRDLKNESSAFSTNLDFVGKYPIGVYAQVAKSVGAIAIDNKDRMLQPLFEKFVGSSWSDKSKKLAELKF